MDSVLLRLLWALPLVVATGILMIWLLKRAGVGMDSQPDTLCPRVLHRVALTETSCAVVVQIGPDALLIVEGNQSISVQRLGADARFEASRGSRPWTRMASRGVSS